jgi:hypothetical protein
MSKNVNRYLAAARANAHENFVNADGQFDDAASFGGNRFASANGNFAMASGMGASAPTSQPYVVNVTSASGVAVANVDVLGSNQYLGKSANWVNGNYVDGGITISSGTPGVTYQEMLYQFQQQPFAVGLTYYQSATTNQVLQTLQIVTKDANGNEAKRPIVPTIDPYQYQTGIVPIKQGYNVDGFTKITIASVLPTGAITFQFYPADKINVAAGLSGSSVAKTYSDPGIVKAQEIVLK